MDLQAIHKHFLLNSKGHRRKDENETVMLLTVKRHEDADDGRKFHI